MKYIVLQLLLNLWLTVEIDSMAACGNNDEGVCRGSCRNIDVEISGTCNGNRKCCLKGGEGAKCGNGRVATCKQNCQATETMFANTFCVGDLKCCIPPCGSNLDGLCRRSCSQRQVEITGSCPGNRKCCLPGGEGAKCGSGNAGTCKSTCDAIEGPNIGNCVHGITCCVPGANGANCGANGLGECQGSCAKGSGVISGDCINKCCAVAVGTPCTYYLNSTKKTGQCRVPGTCPSKPTNPPRRRRTIGLRRSRREERFNSLPGFGSPCTANKFLLCC